MPSVENPASSAQVEGLDRLGEVSQSPTVEKALEAVREVLGMEVAYATDMADGQQLFTHLDGDGESFGVAAGTAMPVEQTYCHRIMEGRLPNVIPDVRADDRAASMPITKAAGVGAFVSVPLVLSDGSVHGTLCAGSHQSSPDLGYRDLRFMQVFARIVADQIERDQLERKAESLERAAHRMELEATSATALIAAVQARDSYTADHSRAVVDSAVEVAHRLDLTEADIAAVEQVALLHDIGKIGVPDGILNKKGPLTGEEWQHMRRHPVLSEEIVSEIPTLRHLAPMVRAEHERWDGAGYPDGLAGEDIPLPSRITLVSDAFHAMTSDRPYRRALTAAAARAEIRAGLGSQFCPSAGQALLDVTS